MSDKFKNWWDLFELECITRDKCLTVVEIVESAWNHQEKKLEAEREKVKELKERLARAIKIVRSNQELAENQGNYFSAISSECKIFLKSLKEKECGNDAAEGKSTTTSSPSY